MAVTAFLGCAHVHTPELAAMAAAHGETLVAKAWDRDRSRAEATAAAVGADVADRVDDITGDAQIDAVFVCSETAHHTDLVEAAVAVGKHVFVEKPLAADSRRAHALATTIERAGVLFQTGHFMRGQAAHRALREAIAAGRLGRVTRVQATNANPAALRGWFDEPGWRWMADPELAGFGGFGDEAVHAADLVLWLLGHPRVERVAATVEAVVGRYGDVDEQGEALVEIEGGVHAGIAAGWADGEQTTEVEVAGTGGRARADGGELRVATGDGEMAVEDLPPDLPHAFELFLDALAGDRDAPLVPVREAAAAVDVVDAAYRAARERAWAGVRGWWAAGGLGYRRRDRTTRH